MRTKLAFWATLLAVLALCAVPSVVWLRSLRDYYRFVTGYEPSTLKPSKSNRIPHAGVPQEREEEDLRFVEFRFSAPKAKSVALNGDFTRWSSPLALARQPEGYWEVLVPLPPGRYRYHFIVDGAVTLDPRASVETTKGQRKASLKLVP